MVAKVVELAKMLGREGNPCRSQRDLRTCSAQIVLKRKGYSRLSYGYPDRKQNVKLDLQWTYVLFCMTISYISAEHFLPTV